MPQLGADELQQIRNAVIEKQIFLVFDESIRAIDLIIQYLSILGGSLETPHLSYLYDCQLLTCASNSNSIAQAVDHAVRSLEINPKIFLSFIV